MEKKLDLKQLFIGTFSFMAKNVFLLLLFGVASFLASFLSFKYAFGHQLNMLFFYGLFSYLFYYLFISLYFEQKPIFTSEKLINSIIKAVIIFALSLVVVILGHLTLKLLKYMAEWLIGFPDIYAFLKNTYHFLNASKFGRFLLYIPMILLLTFTFFVPGFAWVSSIRGGDTSLLSAYARTYGNNTKIIGVLLLLYAVLPFVMSFFVSLKPVNLSLSYALTNIIQLVFYIRLYDFFYQE